jgi:hypothetical protein
MPRAKQLCTAMSLLQEVHKPRARVSREVEGVHSLRFILKLSELEARDAVISTPLRQIFEHSELGGDTGPVIMTDLRVQEHSNDFPFDLELTVSGVKTPLVLSAHSSVSESWNRSVVLLDTRRESRALESLPCSVVRHMTESCGATLSNVDCVGFSAEVGRPHTESHATNGSYMMVAATHPFYDTMWRYAWLHCMESNTGFEATSDILCARTAACWRVPADVLMDVTARMCKEAATVGAPVDLCATKLGIRRFDGHEWLHGLEDADGDAALACTLVLNMRAVKI